MKRPLLLAHRGFSGNYPENSPLAFRMAVEKTAADGFESDVHITKDGKLVIFHDASVERTSNGTGFIKNMTYDELLSLDIGAWKSPEFAGQHIWTFGQLLDFCKETKMLLNMELKNYEVFYENLEQRVIDEICKRQMQEQVFVSSFNHIPPVPAERSRSTGRTARSPWVSGWNAQRAPRPASGAGGNTFCPAAFYKSGAPHPPKSYPALPDSRHAVCSSARRSPGHSIGWPFSFLG